MSATLEDANAALRASVKSRLDATPADDPKMNGYDRETLKAATDHMDNLQAFSEWRRSELPRGAEEWRQLHDELFDLHVEKTSQYGREDSAFANVEASALCGVEPWRRALCDLSDCVVRMQRYANGQAVDYENALKDAAMWAMIALVFLRLERGHG